MMDSPSGRTGRLVLRVVGVVAVVVGVLGALSSAVNGNLVGIVLSAVFIAGGVFALKRSGAPRRAGGSASASAAGQGAH
ncbi:hypothetical protein [Micromonospora sp. NBS 11-29]|uniref:hypothetical protein n=1 Tax=Micromonospora sp. NBS 11-29 TaxID=1960879 RepID=UPI00111F6DFD|nr:hypothetical protein [Micromonospora sp. NBS 11-29]